MENLKDQEFCEICHEWEDVETNKHETIQDRMYQILYNHACGYAD